MGAVQGKDPIHVAVAKASFTIAQRLDASGGAAGIIDCALSDLAGRDHSSRLKSHDPKTKIDDARVQYFLNDMLDHPNGKKLNFINAVIKNSTNHHFGVLGVPDDKNGFVQDMAKDLKEDPVLQKYLKEAEKKAVMNSESVKQAADQYHSGAKNHDANPQKTPPKKPSKAI